MLTMRLLLKLLKHLGSFIVIISLLLSIKSLADDSSATPLMWNLKHFNQHFVGRTVFLKNMDNYFFRQKNNLLVISGGGGVGKADVIQRYAEQHQDIYHIVWWFDVKRDLKEQYNNFALEWNRIVYDDPKKNLLQINLDSISENSLIEQVNDRLRITKLNWLIILDKVNESTDALKHILKKPNNKSYGHIIISTKNSTINANVMRLGKLTREESIESLVQITGENNKSQASILAHTLEDNPIAISRAGLFIASCSPMTMEEYNYLFKYDRQKLWEAEKQLQKQRIKFNSYKATVFSTYLRNIEDIKKESNIAYELLAIAAFLSHENIPEAILSEHFKTKYNKNSVDMDFNNALSTLMKYSLLNRDNYQNHQSVTINKQGKESLFTTDKLAQLVMRDLLGAQEKEYYLMSAIIAISKLLPENPDSDYLFHSLAEFPLFIPHLTMLNQYAIELKLFNSEVLRLCLLELEYNLAGYINYNGSDKFSNNQDAEKLISRIEEISKHLYGANNHASTDELSYFYYKLAIINVKLQQPDEALKYLETHLQIFGIQHPRSIKLSEYFIDHHVDLGF